MVKTYNLMDLQSQIEEIITYSQDYPFDLDCSSLIKKWEKSKEQFIQLFDGNLYIRSKEPVIVSLSEEEQSKNFREFLSTLREYDVLNEDLEEFLLSNQDGFFENKVVFSHPEKKIPAGAKVLRAFKHFIPEPENVKWAQSIASRYIQSNKIEGYLYLSVDPRDFLTLSENNANWTSCHSLDGDYRSGNLSYMTDSVTLVAYLASDKQERLKCMPHSTSWNSKKWRMLVHTSLERCIYYDRQYPYNCSTLVDMVHDMITNLLPKINFTTPYRFGFKTVNEIQLLNTNHIYAGGRSFDMRDILNIRDYRGYSDLIYSNNYVPIAAVERPLLEKYEDLYEANGGGLLEELMSFRNIFGMKIGNVVPCVCCGKENISRDNSFLCNDCIINNDAEEDFFLYCCSCYHRIYEEDIVIFHDDAAYCEKCHRSMLEDDINWEEE